MSKKFIYEYYDKHLKWNFLILVINIIYVLYLLIFLFFMRSFYHPIIVNIIIGSILLIMNLCGIIYNFHKNRDKSQINDKKINTHKGINNSILKFTYFMAIFGYIFSLISYFFYQQNTFDTYFIQPIIIVFLIDSTSSIYYLKHPIYRSNSLSLYNIFCIPIPKKSIRWSNIVIDIIIALMFLYAFLGITVAFIGYISFKVSKIKVSRYKYINGVIKKINEAEFIKEENIRSLEKLEPLLNNICNNILLYGFFILLIIFIIIFTLSRLYSIINSIGNYEWASFISNIAFYIGKFLIVSVSAILVVDKIIEYFEKYPSSLNTNAVLVILLFFPFMEILYLLRTFNNMNTVNIKMNNN